MGGNGADSLLGDTVSNQLTGGDGADTLDGGLGADSLIGGAGMDLVSYAGVTGAVTVDLASNQVRGAAGNDSLSGVEHALGGDGADSLFGDAASNQFTGGDAADTLHGGLGADTLLGGDGQDFLIAGTENKAFFFLRAQQDPMLPVNLSLGNPSFPLDWTASAPAFTDLDKDSDQDLVVGRSDGGYSIFLRDQNGGFVATSSSWGLPPPTPPVTFPPSGAYNSAPSFVDLDSDGDLDAVIGRSDGTLSAFRLDTVFVAMDGQNGRPLNPFLSIDIGALSKPTFTDLDLDGDADLVIGNQEGMLSAFLRNANGSYSQMDGLNGRPVNPFLGIDVGSLSTPFFADLDLDGDQDLVVGSEAGTLAAFRRGADGIFLRMDGLNGRPVNPFDGIDIGSSSAPSFTDLNGDSVLDLVIGSASKTLTTYFAQSDNDRLDGGNGADTLTGDAGADSMIGGAGNDLFIISDTLDRIIEAANGGADTIITSVSATMPDHIETLRIAANVSGVTLTGGAGNDMLVGNGLANNFNGGAGDDVILVGNATLADIYALFAT